MEKTNLTEKKRPEVQKRLNGQYQLHNIMHVSLSDSQPFTSDADTRGDGGFAPWWCGAKMHPWK